MSSGHFLNARPSPAPRHSKIHSRLKAWKNAVTLTNGLSIKTVGKMLGYKNQQTTQHYAKIIDSKVEEDIKVLKEKLGRF